jgi:hypothetical protein
VFLPAIIAGASALLGGIGKKKQQKAAEKKEKESERLAFESAKKTHGVNEKSRIAALKQIASAAGSRGINMGEIPAEAFMEREFTGAAPGKESGRSGFGDFLSGVGNIGMGAADFMGQREASKSRDAQLRELRCQINPMECDEIDVLPKQKDMSKKMFG